MNSTQQTDTVKNSNKLKYGIFLASLVSFYTTYTGMLAIAAIDSNEKYYQTEIMLFVVVLLIQSSLVFGLHYFEFRNLFNRNYLKTIAALFLYMIPGALSIIFSFTFYYEFSSAINHANRSMKLQTEQIYTRLIQSKSSLSAVANSVKKLSEYSTDKSLEEQNEGSTCTQSPIGYGYYTQVRIDDAKITSEAYSEVEQVYKSLSEDMIKIQNMISAYDKSMDVKVFEENINKEISKINNKYFTGDQFESIIDTLLSRSGNNRDNIRSMHRKTKYVATVSCEDKGFTKGVHRIIQKLHDLQPVEKIRFFDAEDSAELLNRTKNVLWATIGFKEIKDVKDMTDPSDITTEDISALGIAVIIDLLILLLSIIDKTPAQQRKVLSLAKVKDILDGNTDSSIYIKLQKFMAEMSNSYMIAIPTDILDDNRIEALNYIVQYIKLKNMATLHVNEVKAEKLHPYFPKNLSIEYSGSSFKIYKMKKRQLEALLLEDISGELS